MNETLDFLRENNFWLKCPCCRDFFRVDAANLFTADNISPQIEAFLREVASRKKSALATMKLKRKKLGETSITRARGINIGFIFERLIVTLDTFKYHPNDCRALFDPIDFIIFDGLHEGNIKRIIFTDVKTGASQLTKKQKKIKALIEDKKVEWLTYD
jgi:predicted Holliday junction resolvase-like endonuclease